MMKPVLQATRTLVRVMCTAGCATLLACGGPTGMPADAGAEADRGVGDDASDCAEVSARIGPDGGELSACGATLIIAPGALSEARMFGIEPIAIPNDGLVFDFSAAATYAYRFTPDDANLGFDARIRVSHNPLDTHEHIVAVYRSVVHPEGWYPIPHCAITEHESEAVVGLLGTFSTLRRNEYYPAGPVGIGTGTLNAMFNGVSTTCDIATSFSGFAISTLNETGTRRLRAMCDAPLTTGTTRITLQLSFTFDSGGVLGPVQSASWQAASESTMWTYSALDSAHGVPSTWFVDESNSHLAGTLVTDLWNGTEHHPLELTFDLVPDPYRERIFDDPVCE